MGRKEIRERKIRTAEQSAVLLSRLARLGVMGIYEAPDGEIYAAPYSEGTQEYLAINGIKLVKVV